MPTRCVLKKRCSQNMQHVYRRIPMPKCDFNKHLWVPASVYIRKITFNLVPVKFSLQLKQLKKNFGDIYL